MTKNPAHNFDEISKLLQKLQQNLHRGEETNVYMFPHPLDWFIELYDFLNFCLW